MTDISCNVSDFQGNLAPARWKSPEGSLFKLKPEVLCGSFQILDEIGITRIRIEINLHVVLIGIRKQGDLVEPIASIIMKLGSLWLFLKDGCIHIARKPINYFVSKASQLEYWILIASRGVWELVSLDVFCEVLNKFLVEDVNLELKKWNYPSSNLPKKTFF